MSYRYIIRYYIDPDFAGDERLEELVRYCEDSHTEEVMLFLTPEELSPGHPTWKEIHEFVPFAKRVKQRLAQAGIELSLNPWTTLYQVPRGRQLREGQGFRRMVGETGSESPLVACPLCPEWQSYLSDSFALLAREIQPVAIWIEDDWRLHNHGGELGWGGCFCEEHMRRFSTMVGEEVTRESLLSRILQPGEPHPWRERWFQLSRASILEPAEKLCQAIRQANPGTRTALMSSLPDQHSAEGRDWRLIEEVIGDDQGFLLRPHMPPYTQQWPVRVTPTVTRQTVACLSREVQPEIYPELENSPRCGIYSKSGRYTVFQMLESALFGSRGITINHYDMLGNGILLDRRFGEYLAAAKPVLNALRELQLEDDHAEGAQVLFSTRVASHLQIGGAVDAQAEKLRRLAMSLQDPSQSASGTGGGESVQQLVHSSVVWGETCAILGISHRYTTVIDPHKGPVLVSGQTLRALTDEEIAALLTGRLFLDADSVQVLLERGYSEAIGIEEAHWQTLMSSGYAYEEIQEEDPTVYGLARPRISAQRCTDRMLVMKPNKGAEILSTIHNAEKQPLWSGAVSYRNQFGGEMISICYPMEGKAQFFMGYFNEFRREFMQRLLAGKQESAHSWAMSTEGTRCYRVKTGNGTLIAILNPTDDTVQELELRLSSDQAQPLNGAQWKRLSEQGIWEQWTPEAWESWQSGSNIRIKEKLKPLQGMFLRIE